MESIGKEETQIKLLKLIDIGMLLAQKYDVVVTNPPYMGNGSIKMSNYLKIFYPNEKYDTYSAIIKRGFNLLKSNGYEAMVTGESWLFLKSFERMRKEIVEKFSLNTLSHFGTGAFEAGFGTVAFVFRKNNVNTSSICINLTQISSNEKENSLLRKVKTKDFFYCILKKLKKIPGVPFAYWIHEELIKTFEKSNLADTMVTKAGIVTGNNDLFMKNWYEVNFFKIKFNSIQFDDIYQTKWVPTNKGGGYRKWFGNIENIVNIRDIWDDSKVNKSVRRGDKNYYFKEGITWSTLSNVLGARKSDIGFVCDTKGSMAFPFNSNDIYRILGIINSSFATEVMNVLSPTLDFNKGYIEQIPYVHIDEEEFIDLVKDNIKISRNDWNNYENSWAFLKSPLIEGNSIENAY